MNNLWLHTQYQVIEFAEYAVLKICISLQSLLDLELLHTEESDDTKHDIEEVYYEEPDLSGGIEGIDYGIVYGVDEEDIDDEDEA